MTKKIIYSLAILFSIVFLVSSCKKGVDKKADEDLAAAVSGQYVMSYFEAKGQSINLPTGSLSGKINIANKDNNVIDMLISTTDTENSNNSGSDTLKDIQLKKENSAINMYYQTTKIGTINGSDLTINIQDGTDQVVIKAKK